MLGVSAVLVPMEQGSNEMPQMKQPAPNTGNWTPSAWFLAQVNHFLASSTLVTLAAYEGWNPWWMVLSIAVASAFKEFVADLTFLEHDTASGSVQDFIFYQLGSLITRLAVWSLIPGVIAAAVVIVGLTVWDIERQKEEPF